MTFKHQSSVGSGDTLEQLTIANLVPEMEYLGLLRLAMLQSRVPMGCIVFVSHGVGYVKTQWGFDAADLVYDELILEHTLNHHDLLVVPDTAADAYFSLQDFVVNAPAIAALLIAPIVKEQSGHHGYVCLANTQPHSFCEQDFQVVRLVTEQISQLFLARLSQLHLTHEYKKYQAILQTSGDGVHVFDRLGNVVEINDKFCEMLGYTRQELLTMNVADWDAMFTPALLRDKVEESFNEATVFETKHKCKDGSIMDVEISAKPVWLDGVLYLWNASRDISVRKNADRLKEHFISTVNHELRTPVTSIVGSLAIILKSMAEDLPEKVTRFLEIAYRNSERLAMLVNDILDIEKLQANAMKFDLQSQRLADIVVQSIADSQPYAEKFHVSSRLINEIPEVNVCVDKHRLLQVLANLLSNAYKFSRQNACVMVKIHQVNHRIRVSVEDQGIGMPDEFKTKIFTPFAQVDSSNTRTNASGTGLGLSISKSIIEKMGGKIGYESVFGQGATFFVEFEEQLAPHV